MELLAKLATAADIPGFNWKRLIIGFTAGQYLFEALISYRQHQVLKRALPPVEVRDVVPTDTFVKSQEYNRAKSKFSFVTSFLSVAQNIAIFHYDVLPKAFTFFGSLIASYGPRWIQGSLMAHSIVFMLGFQTLETIISLPLSLYSTFVIEERFGFNKQTLGSFFADLLKTEALKITIGAPVMYVILKIIDYFGDMFFVYLWLFITGFNVLAIMVYPTLIQPLFNKLTPLADGELKDTVFKLIESVKFPSSKVYVIDGSKRSSHSNAYFYGLPWSKQIVIFDTLIDTATTDQIRAVLAHEIGHWSLSHTTKIFAVSLSHIFAILALFSAFVHNNSLYTSFGFHTQQPILVGFMLFSDILTPVESVIRFAMHLMSRAFEYQADEYAVGLGYAEDMQQALISLHKENLSTVDADWLYSCYHHSHPILPERLRAIKAVEAKRVEATKKEQ